MHEIVLGLIQGLTEFLPVSSSGHLVIVPAMLGWEEPPLGPHRDAPPRHPRGPAHLLPPRASSACCSACSGKGEDPAAARRIVRFLIVGTIPAVVAGLALGGFFEDAFERPYESCIELVITALILIAMERYGERARRHPLDDGRALGIGAAQALAILPGISRSGSTIGAGSWPGSPGRRPPASRSSCRSRPSPARWCSTWPRVSSSSAGPRIAGTVVSGIVRLPVDPLPPALRADPLADRLRWYLFVFAPLSALVIWLRSR